MVFDIREEVGVEHKLVGTGAKLPCVIRKVLGEPSTGRVFIPDASQFSFEQCKPPAAGRPLCPDQFSEGVVGKGEP